MKKLTTTNCAIDDQSLDYIDQQVSRLEPYFDDPDDELPIFDIIVDKGKQPHTYLTSVTIFMPDTSIHDQVEQSTIAQGLRQAFAHLGQKIDGYEADRRHRRQTAQKLFHEQGLPVGL